MYDITDHAQVLCPYPKTFAHMDKSVAHLRNRNNSNIVIPKYNALQYLQPFELRCNGFDI